MGKKGNKQKRYSAEFKISVIMDMREASDTRNLLLDFLHL